MSASPSCILDEKVANLPVKQAINVELTLNLKTANALAATW